MTMAIEGEALVSKSLIKLGQQNFTFCSANICKIISLLLEKHLVAK